MREAISGRARQISVAAAITAAAWIATHAQEPSTGQGFSFHTGVALVNVTTTVTDDSGRFVEGLKKDDFVVYEDGKPQPIQQFETERVPVSLGIAIDTSGSMLGDKIAAAQAALHRFLFDLLGPLDEFFLYRFDSRPTLLQRWTTDRGAVAREINAIHPNGGTALYDAVSEAIPLAQSGNQRKKALVILSDGCDTSSRLHLDELRQIIHESEVLVYAIGIDASAGGNYSAPSSSSSSTGSGGSTRPVPSPFPGKHPPPSAAPPSSSSGAARQPSNSSLDRINVGALRAITDDSGGRTEVVVSSRDIDPATARVADELSRQYFLGYVSSAPHDGKWHTIEVEIRRGHYTVRARKGFIAN